MFSESNTTTKWPKELAHCTTLLIDLTLGEHLQILSERRRGICKSGICDTKSSITLKRSSLEPKLLQSVYIQPYRHTAYQLVTNLETYGKLWPTFRGQNFSQWISRTFCRRTNFCRVRGMANRNLFLWNRAGHYIFVLWFLLLSSFFPRLFSAVADWMSTILPHMPWL